MVTYKNIRVKMRGGKSRLQRVMVLASGKYRFVKNLSKSRSTRTKTTTRKRRVKNVVRRRRYSRKRRGGRKSPLPTLFKLVRLGALAAPAIHAAVGPGTPQKKLTWALEDYTGYNIETGTWKGHQLIEGWGAYLGACAATYGIPKLIGLIRRL